MKQLLESLCSPPGINIAIALAGMLLWKPRRRAALILLAGDMLLLYLVSLPFTAWALMSALQPYPPLTAQEAKSGAAQAIVVLGAGRHRDAPEYGGDTVSRLELERLRYGARLQRLTRLPLMAVGGGEDGRIPEALMMKEAAERDFGVEVAWTETHSRTTAENAVNAAALLRDHGIRRIYLVTHAWHMPRAVWAFRRAGIEVTPAPTAFVTAPHGARAWLPDAQALVQTSLAWHEIAGLLCYRLAVR